MNFFAELLAALGTHFSVGGVQGSKIWFTDEPKMPKCLLDK